MGLGGGRLRTAYPVRVVKAWAIPLTYAVMAAGQIFFALRMDGAARFAAAGCAVVLLAGAFYFRPRALPRSTYDEATRAADEGRVVIYHRPGCVFCAAAPTTTTFATSAVRRVMAWLLVCAMSTSAFG